MIRLLRGKELRAWCGAGQWFGLVESRMGCSWEELWAGRRGEIGGSIGGGE